MQWFRSKSKGKPPVDLPEEEKHALEASHPAVVVDSSSASTSTPQRPALPYDKSLRSPFSAHPTRSASAHTETPLSERAFGGVLGRVGASSSNAAKGTLRVHHGAVDTTTITTSPPPDVMKQVKKVLEDMGIEIQIEGDYKYRCVRPKRKKAAGASNAGLRESAGGLAAFTMVSAFAHSESQNASEAALIAAAPTTDAPAQITGEPIYGNIPQDQGDEVRFSVELTRLDRLDDTYSLDIRRLKGNLRSYKFLYDTLREWVFNTVFHLRLADLPFVGVLIFSGSLHSVLAPVFY
ncbi:hypothetical protein PHLGIDRAFT_72491 [Phlebiopsis gigantea 11061_1 CR5-6]|uniref:non-specific serine/threonine protein kinase n=1 Tax=Phlebiopsis gigantea (strain 11061_1 CR5-6) TaxID=745531 RepID=A0A0C3NNA2_PHLG1|nr:hypothetical protein PHLGIDRAFT_72491 [Phlebiopsis gigantea 11061_1 CR5-6]